MVKMKDSIIPTMYILQVWGQVFRRSLFLSHHQKRHTTQFFRLFLHALFDPRFHCLLHCRPGSFPAPGSTVAGDVILSLQRHNSLLFCANIHFRHIQQGLHFASE